MGAGLKPGQRHEGQFKKGFDPRRFSGYHKGRMEFSALCREHSEEAIQALVDCIKSDEVPWKDRLTAISMLFDHGHGKPVDRIAIQQMKGSSAKAEDLDLPALRQKVAALLENAEKEIDGQATIIG